MGRCSFALVLLVALMPFVFALGSAESIKVFDENLMAPSTAGISCGDTITTDTVLGNDLLGCPGNGLVIGADNITLDCNGHSITGQGTGAGDSGVYLIKTNNVNIVNCRISNFWAGINSNNTNYTLDDYLAYNGTYISRNVLETNTFGVYFSGSANNYVSDNEISGTNGVVILSNINTTITNNNISGNFEEYSMGIFFHGGFSNFVFSNSINGKMSGILLNYVTSNNLSSNDLRNNSVGLYMVDHANGNNIFGNNFTENGIGVLTTYYTWYNMFEQNTFLRNSIYGVESLSGGQTYLNNQFIDNNVSAYEIEGNNWNVSDVGNYWSDFANNTGYPYRYEVPGPGYGVDYHPVGAIHSNPCRQIITANTVLHSDLTDCSDQGVILDAENITLDCAGHTISGVTPHGQQGINGINIRNRLGVVVKNCVVTNFDTGILVDNSLNVLLHNNTLRNNSFGVYVLKSTENTLSNNLASDNLFSGFAVGTDVPTLGGRNNTLKDNVAYGNRDGFALFSSDNNILESNTANLNFNDGILLLSSVGNYLVGNTAGNNRQNGIELTNSFENHLNGNSINGDRSYPGFYLVNSNNNSLSNNTLNNNGFGVILELSSGNEVSGNIFQFNGFGIKLSESFNNSISANIMTNNSIGIGLSLSSNNSLKSNTLMIYGDGIELRGSSGNEIFENSLTGEEGLGVGIMVGTQYDGYPQGQSSFNNYIAKNTVNGGSDGIQLREGSYYAALQNNRVCNNSVGIWAQNQTTNTGSGNICQTTYGWNDQNATGCSRKCETCGELNHDGIINVQDIVFLIDYCFRNGEAPSPLWIGDINGDGTISDVIDVVTLINYVFRSAPEPTCTPVQLVNSGTAIASLGVPTQSSGIYSVPVSLSSSSGISAVQFELSYDPAKWEMLKPEFTQATSGMSLAYSAQAGKQTVGMLKIDGSVSLPAGSTNIAYIKARPLTSNPDWASLQLKKVTAAAIDSNAVNVKITGPAVITPKKPLGKTIAPVN